MSERVYTLAEAARVTRLRACATNGHDWDILQNLQAGPLRIVCGSCGWSGSVTMDEPPRPPDGHEATQ